MRCGTREIRGNRREEAPYFWVGAVTLAPQFHAMGGQESVLRMHHTSLISRQHTTTRSNTHVLRLCTVTAVVFFWLAAADGLCCCVLGRPRLPLPHSSKIVLNTGTHNRYSTFPGRARALRSLASIHTLCWSVGEAWEQVLLHVRRLESECPVRRRAK